jgi:hypothetical protein
VLRQIAGQEQEIRALGQILELLGRKPARIHPDVHVADSGDAY